MVKNVEYWNKISGNTGGMLLYNGEIEFIRSDKMRLSNWMNHPLKF